MWTWCWALILKLLGVRKNCSGFGIFTYFGLANKILKVHVSSLITARSLRRSPAAAILIIEIVETVICAVSIARTCPEHPSKHAWSTRGDTKQRKHSNQRRLLGCGLPETGPKLLSADCAIPKHSRWQIDVRLSRGFTWGGDPSFLRGYNA